MDKKELSVLIGKRIKSARKKAGLTQSELAEILDCSNRYISQIELGQANLSLSKVIDISEALNESVSYIVGGGDHNLNELNEKIKHLSRRDKKIVEKMIDEMLMLK